MRFGDEDLLLLYRGQVAILSNFGFAHDPSVKEQLEERITQLERKILARTERLPEQIAASETNS